MRASWLAILGNASIWPAPASLLVFVLLLCQLGSLAMAMTASQQEALRIESDQLFYHGFDSYLKYAFPEDELRPLNCSPLTRDRANPGRIEVNDPLGNYSLTLVDTLSTLAVLASSGTEHERNKALLHFQDGVVALVSLYGDGTDGASGEGTKARGFDLDSKVSVFETVIRGVGGLLSAHLFAMGDLPITGYNPSEHLVTLRSGLQGIQWSPRFIYDGQLLRLANDLASRILPAFSTSTGIPYPRVNLRYGIPFYTNSCGPDGDDCHLENGEYCPVDTAANAEDTRTCPAGAGTLILEFTVLSRLTGNYAFENAAKRAFWSVWERRTTINLLGLEIDAETGQWLSSYTGLGAGVDSFYEYAFKAYILLSGAEEPLTSDETRNPDLSQFYPPPLQSKHHQPESFLRVWQNSHDAINKHLRRGKAYGYPHFIQGDAFNGAAKAIWMDALSAFYPGLLTLAGHIEEAIENHVLFTALWSRYSALPERWSVASGDIEHGLGWWLGRPEFIESNFYLHRATKDPWYLHVGEMTLKDIKRLCWVPCGLSGIQDVRTLERNNRMESFFLGETAKYLHLLFSADHPLNKMDAPFVFSTEGHPLLIPKDYRNMDNLGLATRRRRVKQETCEVTHPTPALSMSNVAARKDLFHASTLVRLELEPRVRHGSVIEKSPATWLPPDSPSNYTFYPWTLPKALIPQNGTSSPQTARPTFDITFPTTSNFELGSSMLTRVAQGVLVGSLSGIRIGMIQDIPFLDGKGQDQDLYRIHSINHMPLGRDEKILVSRETIAAVVKSTDPLFTRVEDGVLFDLVVDMHKMPGMIQEQAPKDVQDSTDVPYQLLDTTDFLDSFKTESGIALSEVFARGLGDISGDNTPQDNHVLKDIMRYLSKTNPSTNFADLLKRRQPPGVAPPQTPARQFIPAIRSQGAGSTPLPPVADAKMADPTGKLQPLPWTSIYLGDDGCTPLPSFIPRNHQIIILKRGGCSFTEKLANIPAFPPSSSSLQLVIIVSFAEPDSLSAADLVAQNGRNLVRPLLSEAQVTRSGIPRRKPIPLIMIGGGDRVWNEIEEGQWKGVGVRRRIGVESGGIGIGNIVVL